MPISIVGLGLDPDNLPENSIVAIDQAEVLVGYSDHLAYFEDHPAEKIVMDQAVASAFPAVADYDMNSAEIVVLTPGDPLFFGIGLAFIEEFGPENVTVLPGVTTVQLAASRLKVPWQNIATVSLIGCEDFVPLFRALMRHRWVAVLTDARHIPAAVAQSLIDKGADHFAMWVFENLETERERFERYKLPDASKRTFSQPNLAILERISQPERRLGLGIPDDTFDVGRDVITPMPVRSMGLAALRLAPGDTVWDLGAGCGATAIEASSLVPDGLVLVVDKNADRIANVRENVRRFGAMLVEAHHGHLPACLDDLPDPDAIYIGGGLRKSDEVLARSMERLKPGGRLVAPVRRLNVLERCRGWLESHDWPYAITLLSTGHTHRHAEEMWLESNLPVFMVASVKPDKPARVQVK
jgi:precorrin-6Y C5,15-methyltransferase (decarboxylating)